MASRFGSVLAQRLGAALLLWALAGMGKAGVATARLAIVGLGCALALIDTESGHAGNMPPASPAVGVTAVHIAAMGAWVGGLIALLVIWDTVEAEQRRHAAAGQFSRWAATGVLVLAASGAVLAWQHLTQSSDLVSGVYGRTLLAKTVRGRCSLYGPGGATGTASSSATAALVASEAAQCSLACSYWPAHWCRSGRAESAHAARAGHAA